MLRESLLGRNLAYGSCEPGVLGPISIALRGWQSLVQTQLKYNERVPLALQRV